MNLSMKPLIKLWMLIRRISRDYFKGFGIVDCKSTWKPNGLIRAIAGKKAKKFGTTILFDYNATLQESVGFAKR